jgi:hypothetical protein
MRENESDGVSQVGLPDILIVVKVSRCEGNEGPKVVNVELPNELIDSLQSVEDLVTVFRDMLTVMLVQ